MDKQEDLAIAKNLGPSGFWSYAHDDDELDGGAILKLAQLIAQEYDLLSGGPINLFVDRDSLAWGEEWRARIDSALTETTFFIAVITPRYFTREECRRELLEFTAKAKSLGVEELLLPLLYVKPSDFSPENPDEAVSMVARMQYADWTAARLLEPASREYRNSINKLALRLIEIGNKVTREQLNRELRDNESGDEPAGIGDLMSDVISLLPEWIDAVMGDRVINSQFDATWDSAYKPIVRLQKSHAPASAIMAAQMRLGKEMLPIFERRQREARVYLARSAELDPLVSALARLVKASPQDFVLVTPLREAIDEAMENITSLQALIAGPRAYPIQNQLIELSRRARIFQKCLAIWRDGNRLAHEGNEIVQRWDAELQP